MKLLRHRILVSTLIPSIFLGAILGAGYLSGNSRAQEKAQLPGRTGYVNDFAQVVDEATRQRLDIILDNLKKRSGIELNLATVQTTGTNDISTFSRQLADDWGVGSRDSSRKTLLLVVAVDEKTVFTRPSKSVQGALPEGILGELNQRVRGPITSGHFSQGLSEGVDHFVAALAKKVGFSLEDIDQAQSVASTAKLPGSEPSPITAMGNEVVATQIKMAVNQEAPPSSSRPRFAVPSNTPSPAGDESSYAWMSPTSDESEEVELTLTLPLADRIVKLKEFLVAYPNSKSKPRAIELLISSYAGLGDQRLKSGDNAGGIEQLMLAISEAPANISDQLFSGVVAQIPVNLFFRAQRNAAIEAAQKIETKFGADPKRLLTLAGFYLAIEDGNEAARMAAEAVRLAPDLAEAHYVLGRSLHISLRLDEAAAEYKRSLELDPNSKKGTRRSLADLTRASGKAEEALGLYREQLKAEPSDKAARAGVVLSLLDLGRLDEGNKELAAVLQEDPRNLVLLTGAAYWLAAHNEADRSLELARTAVQLEPRYTWSQIALGRALTGKKMPMAAERALRFARQYGNFPTLDYELANVLSAAGLYEEAAEVLLQSFTLKDDKIEARLAGRVAAQEPDFIRLLAPERRAAIFQFTAADNQNEAAVLKALLAFATATSQPESVKLDEATASRTAKEFSAGADNMRVYRQLYAAGVLIRKGVALQTAFELTEAARNSVESALEVPAATVAAQSEELRDIRARAIAKGSTPDVPDAPRNVLANILRGRIEDSAGWALYNQGKTDEAIEHLKRAAGILPEGTPLWRNALWHLGAALDQSGKKTEALGYYIKSYNSGNPDPGRRAVIEQLYQKTNGLLDGLDEQIGAARRVALNASSQTGLAGVDKPATMDSASSAVGTQATASPESSATGTSAAVSGTGESAPLATPEASPDARQASPTPTPTVASAIQAPAASPEPRRPAGLPDVVAEMKAKPRTTVKLTGSVRDANNVAIPNVVVVLISPRGSVLATTTDTDGNYSFLISPSPLSYRIIPSKDGHSFDPVDRVLAGLEDDQKAVDFIGKAPPTP